MILWQPFLQSCLPAMPYFGLASLTDPAPQTLGATSFPCFGKASLPKVAEVAALFKRLQAACDANPNLRLSINVFDADAHGATIEAGGLRCSPAEEPLPLPSCAERELVTTVAGMKALYWKKVLTPAATAQDPPHGAARVRGRAGRLLSARLIEKNF